jgi:hypothetical protein
VDTVELEQTSNRVLDLFPLLVYFYLQCNNPFGRRSSETYSHLIDMNIF